MSTQQTAPPPIDPLAPTVNGVYRDPRVEVAPAGVSWPGQDTKVVRTAHFDVSEARGRLRVVHDIPAEAVNADLAGLLYEELFAPGWLRGSVLLERLVTGVVLTGDADPLAAWELFYRNTLTEIERRLARPSETRSHLGDFAPVYGHVQELVGTRSVLELGCSLGFLSLRLAGEGLRVEASDINPGTVRLLDGVSRKLGVTLTTRLADAARYPVAGTVAGTVIAVHLLEHVDDATGRRILDQALRLARDRVVIAVPFEKTPDPTWGHLRVFDCDRLAEIGRSTGRRFDVHEYHGGWLTIDLG